MHVSALLTLMGHLSLGNDNVTPVERAIFLQYLNLAHFELYQITATFNQDLLIFETLANDPGENTVTLKHPPYAIQSLYDQTRQKKLTRISLSDLLEKDPAFKATGYPYQYYLQGQKVAFYPVQTAGMTVKVSYTPQPLPFTEHTPEPDIPYPLAYHPVLVDGALYYLFQEEGGFKNAQKAVAAEQRWNQGQSRLLSYLYNTSGETLSTFMSV
jgi:hypothetical protein